MNKIKKRNTKANHIKNNAICEIKEKIRDELEKLTDKNYADKIIRDEKTQMVTCIFENKTQMDSYKLGHRIDFKNTTYPREIKKEKDEKIREKKILEYENKRISSFINLKERLHDEYLSKEYCDKLGIPNAKVVVLDAKYEKRGEYKQGAAVHISASHKEIGNNLEIIENINKSFVDPIGLEIYRDNEQSFRYFFITKYDKDYFFYKVLDKIDENTFEFFDIYKLDEEKLKNRLKKSSKL